MKEGNLVWWVRNDSVPEWWWGRWNDASIMPSPSCTSLWGQCCDLGLLQLVRSRFSNIMCPKTEISWLSEYSRLFHQWIFFFLDDMGIFQDFARLHEAQTVKELLRKHGIIFTHGLSHHSEQTIEDLRHVLERALRSGPTIPSSPRDLGEKWMWHWTEINLATLQKPIDKMLQHMFSICYLVTVAFLKVSLSVCSFWPLTFHLWHEQAIFLCTSSFKFLLKFPVDPVIQQLVKRLAPMTILTTFQSHLEPLPSPFWCSLWVDVLPSIYIHHSINVS